MNGKPMIYGNLALATAAPEPVAAPAFTVIPGGRQDAVERAHPHVFASVVRLVAAALLVASLAGAVFHIGASRAETQQDTISSLHFEEVRVAPGASLWSLAEDHAVEGISTDVMVDVLMEENGLSSAMLHPGQKLLVAK